MFTNVAIINILTIVFCLFILYAFFMISDSLIKIVKELHKLNENIRKNKINEDKDL